MGGGDIVHHFSPGRPIIDMYEFDKNRAAFPPEQLLQYRGKYIAWSPDGKSIVASDEDLLKLDELIKELGYEVRRGYALTDDVVDGRPVVTLGVGPADEAPVAANAFDCVTIANAMGVPMKTFGDATLCDGGPIPTLLA